jgi:hypothetical protein
MRVYIRQSTVALGNFKVIFPCLWLWTRKPDDFIHPRRRKLLTEVLQVALKRIAYLPRIKASINNAPLDVLKQSEVREFACENQAFWDEVLFICEVDGLEVFEPENIAFVGRFDKGIDGRFII